MITNQKIESVKSAILDNVDYSKKGKVNDLIKNLTKEIIDSHFKESKHLLEVLHEKSLRDI